MTEAGRPAIRFAGAVLAALAGGLFFFAIIGVFGMTVAILGLLVFVLFGLVTFRRVQRETAGP